MDLQTYSHYCFSKISRTLFDFLKNTYWVSLFQRNNLLIFWTWVSCFSVTLFYFTLFCCGGKANLVRFTLFYSTLLTLTEKQNDGWRNEYTRFVWAGETFFQLCCCVVSVFGSGGKKVLIYICMYYLECNTVVVVCQFFLVLVGNSFWCYAYTQCTIQLCCCVCFVVVAGNSSQNENMFIR